MLAAVDRRRLPPRADQEGLQPLRILVVEDEVFVRLDIELQLELAGYEVVGSADSADEAILVAERELPDLVLMDVRLVGPRDGIDAGLELWQRCAIKCLFVSANLDSGNRGPRLISATLGVLAEAVFAGRTPCSHQTPAFVNEPRRGLSGRDGG